MVTITARGREGLYQLMQELLARYEQVRRVLATQDRDGMEARLAAIEQEMAAYKARLDDLLSLPVTHPLPTHPLREWTLSNGTVIQFAPSADATKVYVGGEVAYDIYGDVSTVASAPHAADEGTDGPHEDDPQ